MGRTLLAIPLIALALGFTACGSDEGSGSSTTADAEESGGGAGDSTYLAELDGQTQAMIKGNFSEPKESSPAAKNKKVVVLSCGQVVPSCSIPAAAAQEAGKQLGWDVTLIDGKFSPPEWVSAVDTAIASKADAIMLISVDCQFVRPQLEKARKAGMEIGAMYAIDCDDETVGKEALYTAPMIRGTEANWREQVSEYEADRMKVLIDHGKGKAKVIDFNQDSLLITKIIRKAGEVELAKCKGCKLVETVPIALADTPAVIQQKTQSALNQHPDATALFPLYDGMTLSGVAAGLKASARSDAVFLMGADAFPPSIDLIREGTQDAQLGFPAEWAAYAVFDGLNRRFNDMKPQDSGIGWQLIDKKNNLPESGGWQPDFDYKNAYLKLWGVN